MEYFGLTSMREKLRQENDDAKEELGDLLHGLLLRQDE